MNPRIPHRLTRKIQQEQPGIPLSLLLITKIIVPALVDHQLLLIMDLQDPRPVLIHARDNIDLLVRLILNIGLDF